MKIAESWAELIGTVLLVVVAIYGIREYREHKAGVQVEQMERLYDAFYSAEMVVARTRAAAKPGEFGRAAHRVFVFFEKVARWEEKGLVNVEDIEYYFHDHLLLYWYRWERAIKEIRRSQGQDPETGSLYEGVQRVVTRMERELGVKPPSDANLNEWLLFERDLAVPNEVDAEVETPTAPAEPAGGEDSGTT